MNEFMELRLPTDVDWGIKGGPRFQTYLEDVPNGEEERNRDWDQSRPLYDIAYSIRDASQYLTVLSHFYVVGGRAAGWRLKDWMDYQIVNSLLGNGIVRTIAAPTTGLVRAANVVTATTTAAHTFSLYDVIELTGAADSGFNGTFTITEIVSTTVYRYAQTGVDASSGNGTVKKKAFQVRKQYTKVDLFSTTLTHNRLIFKTAPDVAHAVRVNGILKTETTHYTFDHTKGLITFVTTEIPADGLTVHVDCEFDVPVRFDVDYLPASYESFQLHTVQSIPVVALRMRQP